jgi:hypothetical protein
MESETIGCMNVISSKRVRSHPALSSWYGALRNFVNLREAYVAGASVAGRDR